MAFTQQQVDKAWQSRMNSPAYQAALFMGGADDHPSERMPHERMPDLTPSQEADVRRIVFNTLQDRTGKAPSEDDVGNVFGLLSNTQKFQVAINPTAANAVINEAIKEDKGMAMRMGALSPQASLTTPEGGAASGQNSLMALDAFGRNAWARMTGAAGAGASAGSGSSSYGALAAKEYDADKGWGSLTAENFSTSPFAKVGLDYSTTMRLAAQGFSPAAIKATANLVNDLGIDMKKFAEPVAQLRRDVPGADKAMRENKHKSEDLVGLQEKLDKAKTDEERERLRKEMDEKRQKLEEWRKQQSAHAEKVKPGSGEKLMGVFRATEEGLQARAADKKMKDELNIIHSQPDSEAAKKAKARMEERAKADPAYKERLEGVQKSMKKLDRTTAAMTKQTTTVTAETARQSQKNEQTAMRNGTKASSLMDDDAAPTSQHAAAKPEQKTTAKPKVVASLTGKTATPA